MNEHKFSCPHCDQRIACDETCCGQSIHCPNCQQVITVPSVAAAPAPGTPRLSVRPPAESPQAGPEPAQALPPPPQPSPNSPLSSMAVASLVLSLLSLILGPFGYIPGIICGHLAQGRLRRDAWLRGAGFAKAGLIVGYLGLTLTIAFVGFTVLKARQLFRASAAEIRAASTSVSGMMAASTPVSGAAVGNSKAAPVIAGPAPVSVKVQDFRSMAAGKKGGFTLVISNVSRKPVASLLLQMEYRDADGVRERDVPSTLGQTLPPNGTITEQNDDFFMLPTTRSVTVSVREVTFADGGEWSQLNAALAAAAPGPLSFAGQATPASVEVIRFRPNTAGQGNIAYRLINHSNKAIQEFELDVVCLDGTGKQLDRIPEGWSFLGPDLAIGPGGSSEYSKDMPSMKAAARSGTFVVRSLTFAGGEKWVPARK